MALLTKESIAKMTDDLIRQRREEGRQPLVPLKPHWGPSVIQTSQVDAKKLDRDEKMAALRDQIDAFTGEAPKLGSLTEEFLKATDSDEERENVSRSMDILFERIEDNATE